MRLILIGSPGSGKGTQAKLLSERLGLVHISTGDMMRDAIARGTPAGRLIEPYVKGGKLVPDPLVNELVSDLFRRKDRSERFVLDGYPRTQSQAATLDQVLKQHSLNLCAVILLAVKEDEIVRRLSGRWACPHCHLTYHVTKNPPRVDNLCDQDRTPLIQREDDRDETIRRRLQLYHQSTEELIPHYRAQGLLREVPGVGDIESIYASLVEALKQAGMSC